MRMRILSISNIKKYTVDNVIAYPAGTTIELNTSKLMVYLSTSSYQLRAYMRVSLTKDNSNNTSATMEILS
jgi:hypothetical protein